ncbi:GTPase Era [Candidatus Steffania adelgidicola]|uniref:GTPase Era n=1 Tax=Candidatus Steffania adelgidicola TaxID=1076626 RepID=UPI001D0027AB|nr:GTPase Era [Candidatus Steffania adelgidicola]UDG79658.1 GTPase Era [Candidatus Steffania adelgidicola]
MIEKTTYCGFVAIIGRPNVGKSTLLNQLLGQKISITSHKPQTTRHRIMGICTEDPYQAIYVDTPGLHIKQKWAINRLMNRTARSSLCEVDMVIFVVEGTHWTRDDAMVVNKLLNLNCLVVMAINKVDKITEKEKLLPHIKFLNQQMNFHQIIPICAKNGMNVNGLVSIVRKALPKAKYRFPKEQITDRSHRFIGSEIIREKLIRFLGDELPYAVTVKIERLHVNERGGYQIQGFIFVERFSQKKIVIGNKGSKIKIIGINARQDMEEIFKTRVHLELWVKVKTGWVDDESVLRSFGYLDDF